MAATPIYRALADAFVAEGADTLFVLTGDGNMHWEVAFAEHDGVRSYHVRHEHCACAMASAYAMVTGKVGVASVTCGPGLTQIMTALATAAQGRIPLVVFAGETPMKAIWYNQDIDQAPLVKATGAHYISAHSPARMLTSVRDAFFIAKTERRPVVLGVPLDLQQQPMPEGSAYIPSSALIPDTGRMMPNPEYVEKAADRIAAAERVILIGGRGAKRAEALAECEELANLCGGLLASTLPVRGLFDHSPHSIGLAGGFAHEVARETFAQADLVIAVGASLTHHTVDGGRLFPDAEVIQIDLFPTGIRQGLEVADLYVRADARAGLRAIIQALNARHHQPPSGWRSPDLAARMSEPADSAHFDIAPGTLHPLDVIRALDEVVPKDWEIVNASGHCSYYAAQMRGRSADNFLAIREFGAIGNGLSYAIGMAAAKPDRNVLLVDGDGGLMMHVQELETIRRHNLKILLCILNDGAFGSEIHKLRADRLDDHGATFGRGDLGRLARGFDLRGTIVSDLGQLPDLLKAYEAGDRTELWDFHISDQVMSPVMRKLTSR
jgi:thiamine pyrophosphate-dependent acetolactate synthase large subunit-like protein